MLFHCWKCGGRIEYPAGSRVGRRDACLNCGADLHSCGNCQFYDPSKNGQCAESQADWVRDKEAANLCNFYSPNPTLLARGVGRSPRPATPARDSILSLSVRDAKQRSGESETPGTACAGFRFGNAQS